jgi:glycosyltransferase involved in cell wall biosynthesis
MRIAHIVGTFPPYFAGVGNVCYHNAFELAKLGHDVTVFTSDFPKGKFSYPEILKVKRLKYLFKFGGSPFLPGLLDVNDYEIIHLHYPFYFGDEIIYFSSKLRKFDYVLTYHMDVCQSSFPIGWLRNPIKFHEMIFNRRIVRSAKKIIVTSTDYAQNSRLSDIFKEKCSDVTEIPLGVDLDFFRNEIGKWNIRQKYAIKEYGKVILFVGALDKQHYFKGIEYLLKAFSKVENDNVQLLIVGDGNLKACYMALSKELGISAKTIFAGRVEDVMEYYHAADLLVLPSIDMSEAFGLVLVEAMASGIPVIASNLPGVRKVVENGFDGLLVEPGNVEDLLSKIKYLLSNDEVRVLFGKRGKKKVKERYLWNKIALQLEDVYSEVLKQRKS